MNMVKPSEMVSRLDLVVLELAAAGIVFRRLPEGFWDFRVFTERKGGGTEHRGGQHPLAAPGACGVAWWVFPTSVSFSGTSTDPRLSSGPKKSTKSFAAFRLRLIWIFCKSKTGQKTATGTWHYVNRLIPKNDIKLIGNHYKTSKIDHISNKNRAENSNWHLALC